MSRIFSFFLYGLEREHMDLQKELNLHVSKS